jgi:hypothetical protein
LIVLGAEPAVEPLGVVVENGLLEDGLVEDALEDLLVVVHAPHDCVEELAVEDQAEVGEVVVARARGQLLVRGPRLFELVEEELIYGIGGIGVRSCVYAFSRLAANKMWQCKT